MYIYQETQAMPPVKPSHLLDQPSAIRIFYKYFISFNLRLILNCLPNSDHFKVYLVGKKSYPFMAKLLKIRKQILDFPGLLADCYIKLLSSTHRWASALHKSLTDAQGFGSGVAGATGIYLKLFIVKLVALGYWYEGPLSLTLQVPCPPEIRQQGNLKTQNPKVDVITTSCRWFNQEFPFTVTLHSQYSNIYIYIFPFLKHLW